MDKLQCLFLTVFRSACIRRLCLSPCVSFLPKPHSSTFCRMAAVVLDFMSFRVHESASATFLVASVEKRRGFPQKPPKFFLGSCWSKLDDELVISWFKPNHDSFSMELRAESFHPSYDTALNGKGKISKAKPRGRGMDIAYSDVQHSNNSRSSIIWPQRATLSPSVNPSFPIDQAH